MPEPGLYCQRVPGWKSSGTFPSCGMYDASVSPRCRRTSVTSWPSPPLRRPDVWVRRSRTSTSRWAGTSSTSGGGASAPSARRRAPATPVPAPRLTPPSAAGAPATSSGDGVDPGLRTATLVSRNSGMKRPTGSSGLIRPSSICCMTATPTTGFVDDAIRKIASTGISTRFSMSFQPWASKCTTSPFNAIAVTAPEISPFSTCSFITSLTRDSLPIDMRPPGSRMSGGNVTGGRARGQARPLRAAPGGSATFEGPTDVIVSRVQHLARGRAAVDGDRRAADVAGPIRCQEGDDISDLFGLAWRRVGGHQLGPAFGVAEPRLGLGPEEVGQPVGHDQSGVDGDDADVVPGGPGPGRGRGGGGPPGGQRQAGVGGGGGGFARGRRGAGRWGHPHRGGVPHPAGDVARRRPHPGPADHVHDDAVALGREARQEE